MRKIEVEKVREARYLNQAVELFRVPRAHPCLVGYRTIITLEPGRQLVFEATTTQKWANHEFDGMTEDMRAGRLEERFGPLMKQMEIGR